MVAHVLWEHGVAGSNPVSPTIKEIMSYKIIEKNNRKRKNVGEYIAAPGTWIEAFVKVIQKERVVPKSGKPSFDITRSVTKDGLYVTWYTDQICFPKKSDLETYKKYDLDIDEKTYKTKFEYEVDDCVFLIGKIFKNHTTRYFINEDGDLPRCTQLKFPRIIKNVGKK